MTEPKLYRRGFLAVLGGLITSLSIPDLGSPAERDGSPGPQRSPGHFGDIQENTTFDVCIIGSGFAGAILGDALVKHDIKTVILESGADPRGKSIDPRIQQLDTYRSSGPIEYPVAGTRFRGVGGTSWLWAGTCPRLEPIDFENNPYTPAGAPWPIRYKDLQSYYEKAEQALRIRGGKRSKYHPPMNVDYPIPPDRDVSPLQSLLTDIGIVISDIPTSTQKDRHPSFLSNRSGPYVQMTDSHLPEFQDSSFASLISEVTVTRLIVDEAGNVTGVEIKDLNRNSKIVRARVYVVACGGLETPRLLLLSRASGFPNGIGNNRDLVGRFFMEHRPAVLSGQVSTGWRTFSLYALRGQSYQFYETFKNDGLGGVTLGFNLGGAVDGQELGAWEIGKALNRISARNLEITIEPEMKPTRENRVTLDTKNKDYFGNPGTNLFLTETEEDRKTVSRGRKIVRKIFADLGVKQVEELPRTSWGHHHMGTCRMGENPQTSVVDPNLRVHGTKNLFVAGSSVFVTSGTANPTLTLTALTFRLADHLRAQLQNGAFPAPGIARHKVL
jgi:glucose dehydrogenase